MKSLVEIRQAIDRFRHRLFVVPVAFVGLGIILVQALLWVDRRIETGTLPQGLETTVASGRAILSTVAGGLIASITLLLSLMLVAVQLSNAQFSPRTTRDWIGDRTQQITIGVVLGTTVYCLLALRRIRTIAEGEALTPHLTVLIAVLLGVISLIAVVKSVDHLTDSLRIGSVAGRIASETIALVHDEDRIATYADPASLASGSTSKADAAEVPRGATAVTSKRSGWIQQVDIASLLEALPDDSTALLAAGLGEFVPAHAPLAWVWPPVDDDEALHALQSAFAVGDTRTMQQDIGFGILQMVDVALRALSPGVNDPNTANDMIAHLGAVLIALWETPAGARKIKDGSRTVITSDLSHEDYLGAAFDQLRRYGSKDIEVASTMIRTLQAVCDESDRRDLPGPTEPIRTMISTIVDSVEATGTLEIDKDRIRQLAAVT